MSTDNWHLLSRLPSRLPRKDASLGAALESLDEVMMACVSLAGFAMDDMTRDESWQFLPMGRRLERLAHLARMVAHVVGLPAAERGEALEWLLEAANSIVTFRARYRRAPELLPVLHLIVLDETNPHAVAFQLRELALALVRTHAQLGGDISGEEIGAVIAAFRNLPLAGFEPERGEELEASCKNLAGLLERSERLAYHVSDGLGRRFFTHAGYRSERRRRDDAAAERIERSADAWRLGARADRARAARGHERGGSHLRLSREPAICGRSRDDLHVCGAGQSFAPDSALGAAATAVSTVPLAHVDRRARAGNPRRDGGRVRQSDYVALHRSGARQRFAFNPRCGST